MQNSIKENLQIKNKKFKKVILAGTLALSMIASSLSNNNIDAKKKNTKPKLTMKGKLKKKKISLNVGQSLPLKYTAKDKEDGNLTKKVKVKIKKPKGGKIKKTKKNIKFLKIGKYKLTFSVKDKNKKAATKTITVDVKNKVAAVKNVANTNTNTNVSTNTTNTSVNTLTPSDNFKEEIKKYGNYEQVVVGNNTYNYVDDFKGDVENIDSISNLGLNVSNYSEDRLMDFAFGIGNNSKLKNTDPEKIIFATLGNIKCVDPDTNIDYTNDLFFAKGVERDDFCSFYLLTIDENKKLRYIEDIYIYYGEFDKVLFILNQYRTDFSPLYNDVYYDAEDEFAIIPAPKQHDYTVDNTEINLTLKK